MRGDQVKGFASSLRIFSTNAFSCLTPCSDWSRMTFSSSFTAAKFSASYSSLRVKRELESSLLRSWRLGAMRNRNRIRANSRKGAKNAKSDAVSGLSLLLFIKLIQEAGFLNLVDQAQIPVIFLG